MSVAGEARAVPLPARPSALASGAALRAVAIAAVCAIPVFVYLPFLTEPLMRDEGFYAAVGQLVLDGGIPYRDAFDNKPPLVFAWYALSFLLFGENVWAPRLLVSFLLSLTSLLVYTEGRLLFSHRAGLVAAAAFGLSLGIAEFETNANTEFFMLLPGTAALVCLTMGRRTDSPWWYALCGFTSAAAIMTKDFYLIPFAYFVVLTAIPAIRQDGAVCLIRAQLWRTCGALVGGSLIGLALIVAPFVVTGTFSDMFQAGVVYTLSYIGKAPFGEFLIALAKSPLYQVVQAGPIAILPAIAIVYAARRGLHGHGPPLVGWLIANFVGLTAAGRFYDHYYVAMLPCFALLVPVGLRVVRDHLDRLPVKAIAYVLLPLSVITPIILSAEIYLQPNAVERHRVKYHGDPRTEWEIQGPEFGRWLQARTSPDDYIWNFGFQSEIYFYADRKSPTRYLFDHAFDAGPDYEEDAIRELEEDLPVYILDSARYELDTAINYYSEPMKSWIDEHYDYLGKVYYADVYVLKEPS